MKGRPPKSKIRKRIAAILQHLNASYGYEIYKHYKTIYGPVKMRTVYYNLRKGVLLNEFLIYDIKREVGNYTWGSETERIYYSNGPYAEPEILDEMQRIKLEKTQPKETELNEEQQEQRITEEIENEIEEYSTRLKTYTVQSRKRKHETIENKLKKLKKWTRTPEIKTRIDKIEQQLKNYEY